MALKRSYLFWLTLFWMVLAILSFVIVYIEHKTAQMAYIVPHGFESTPYEWEWNLLPLPTVSSSPLTTTAPATFANPLPIVIYPPAVQGFSDIAATMAAVASIIGLIATTVLAWYKERREGKLSQMELEKMELEIEKLRQEVNSMKKTM